MPSYIIGDIHGHLDRLIELLHTAGLINKQRAWCGGDATLCCVGDYVNHGKNGIGVLDLLMQLQPQIEDAGGRIIPLLGNHDAILLAAYHLRDQINPYLNRSFVEAWRSVGAPDDLACLTPQHVAWLEQCHAMTLLENRLILHADAPFYLRYGDNVAEVNARFAALMQGTDAAAWADWLRDFSAHHAFYQAGGTVLAQQFLHQFGGTQLIHGHSTIKTTLGLADTIASSTPLVYAGGLVLNVDGGDASGAPGFVYYLQDK